MDRFIAAKLASESSGTHVSKPKRGSAGMQLAARRRRICQIHRGGVLRSDVWEYASRPALSLPSLHDAALAAAAQARPIHEIPIQPRDIRKLG